MRPCFGIIPEGCGCRRGWDIVGRLLRRRRRWCRWRRDRWFRLLLILVMFKVDMGAKVVAFVGDRLLIEIDLSKIWLRSKGTIKGSSKGFTGRFLSLS